jgi:hypothetical protein
MISGVVFEALRGLVNDRCYPSRLPQEDVATPGVAVAALNKPTWPSIRYTIVSGSNEGTICGTDTRETDDTIVQVDVVAQTHGAMTTLVDLVIAAMMSTTPPCIRDGGGYIETWDPETKTHRGVLTYQFFASTPGGVSP